MASFRPGQGTHQRPFCLALVNWCGWESLCDRRRDCSHHFVSERDFGRDAQRLCQAERSRFIEFPNSSKENYYKQKQSTKNVYANTDRMKPNFGTLKQKTTQTLLVSCAHAARVLCTVQSKLKIISGAVSFHNLSRKRRKLWDTDASFITLRTIYWSLILHLRLLKSVLKALFQIWEVLIFFREI